MKQPLKLARILYTSAINNIRSFNLDKLRLLWHSLTPSRRRQFVGLQILSLLAAAGEVANLGALLPFLRLLANPTKGLKHLGLGPLSTWLRSFEEYQLLLFLGLGFLTVVILSTTLRVLTNIARVRLSSMIAADLGINVFSSVLNKPFSWHIKYNTSDVLGVLTKDVDQVVAIVQSILIISVNFSIVVLLSLSLFALAPLILLLIGILLFGFYFVVFRFTKVELKADGFRLTSNYQKSLQSAQEGLGGIRDVILDRCQQYFLDTYQSYTLNFRLARASIDIKSQVPRYLIECFAIVVILVLSIILALRGQNIEEQLPLLGALSLGAYRILQPAQLCFTSISTLQSNQASLVRLQPFLQISESRNTNINSTDQKSAFSLENKAPLLHFNDVSFKYFSGSSFVLNSLNFSIYAGERIAFVGSTGSGKSTTSDLILGLLLPSEGKLIVDGEELHSSCERLDQWQKRIAHVPQQIFLSDSTFESNIAFGLPADKINHYKVRTAAKLAQIHDLIESSSHGYNTLVGERGVKLSGGQRQRVGLARALYRQADLLVLDEATSALDNQTEANVMNAIKTLDRKITIISIAHRLSTVKNCDRIFVFNNGTIEAIGSFEYLQNNSPTFQALTLRGGLL